MNSIGVFLSGLALGLLVWAFSRLGRKGGAGKDTVSPGGPTSQAPPTAPGERDVYIPGRNFEEMLQRLGSNESMLNVILNSMGEGVLLLNQADRLVLMNPSAEKILGTTEKEGLGKHYLEVVRHPALADLLTHSKKGGYSSGEIDFGGKEEKTFVASVAAVRAEGAGSFIEPGTPNASPRLVASAEGAGSFIEPGTPNASPRLVASAEGGLHLGQIVVFSDITSLKRLMRMRTEFVANVSHELKTPLTAILGYVETLVSGAIEDKKNRTQFLGKISDQAQKLHALITDVLELSRIESGAFVNQLSTVDLAETAQQAVEILKAKWEAKEITVRQEIPAGVRVTAHREGMFHVLENLLDNAIKYSPAKTVIRIYSTGPQEGKVSLRVEDQGSGIPKEAQSRVFERFFRVDASRSREMGGTGLGLAIVKHLVEKMGGEVFLESKEGKGSVFTIILPESSR